LPLQSGSDRILRRMNRQYNRDDFRRMLARVHQTFDRPALTTDAIVGFPGESDAEFERTVEICQEAGFIHIHAFSFSPRPGTAAARWTKDFVRGPVVNERINALNVLAAEQSFAFRRSFLGQTVQILVESPNKSDRQGEYPWHGRTERYFPVHFQSEFVRPGMLVDLRVEEVTADRTIGVTV
jgi:threonylcarbamoyladenosine tRNA methylthiotransferase MtaB